MNLYRYCGNNPGRYTDPSGLYIDEGGGWVDDPVYESYMDGDWGGEPEYAPWDYDPNWVGETPNDNVHRQPGDASEQGWWNPLRWLYTGDGYASDDVYEAALQGAADSLAENIPSAQKALDAVSYFDKVGLASATNAFLDYGRGDDEAARARLRDTLLGKLLDKLRKASGIGRNLGAKAPGKTSTLKPGPYKHESIPGHYGRLTAEEQRRINELFKKHGCHTCGTKKPGTQSGNAIGDHQPPQSLGEPEQILPQCIDCMRTQGGEVRQQLLRETRGG